MRLNIQAPWRATEDEMLDDQKFLRNLFKTNKLCGHRSIPCADPECDLKPNHDREYAATFAIDTGDYIIS